MVEASGSSRSHCVGDEGAGRRGLRVAEPEGEGGWKVNEWVKQAVLLNFPIQSMTTMEVGPFEFHDKMPLKKRICRGWCVVPTQWCAMGPMWRQIAF